MKPLVIGTRGSQLAMWQARWVEEQLAATGVPCRIRVIKTSGDKLSSRALSKLSAGAKGLFTKEIEEALIKGRIDLAVHSVKDLPTEFDRRLILSAVLERGDPRDALVAADELSRLPEQAKIATSSPRRAAQIIRLRRDLRIEDIRGNVDTRLRKLDEGRVDGVILAVCGLERLGLEDRISETFETNRIFPAVGQGAVGIQTRKKDRAVNELVTPLNHPESAMAIHAERTFLAALGGGCRVPIAGYARLQGERLRLSTMVVSVDGSKLFCRVVEGNPANPEALGQEAAERLLALGAGDILSGHATKVRKAAAKPRVKKTPSVTTGKKPVVKTSTKKKMVQPKKTAAPAGNTLAKKALGKKTSREKAVPKKKVAAKPAATKKAPAKKVVKKAAAKKAPAKKAVKKAVTKKAPVKKAVKKTAAKKAPAKKVAKKTATKKAPAKKTVKKAATKGRDKAKKS